MFHHASMLQANLITQNDCIMKLHSQEDHLWDKSWILQTPTFLLMLNPQQLYSQMWIHQELIDHQSKLSKLLVQSEPCQKLNPL